ncbi:uncharacterized protein LOC123886308 [Trifolium pratense]|uniref:uncharacterized protein LOC123886308 n=1 Tax=Trifolium pratense TaxID=57577 RepID=UPI001E69157A|nr:uncharacterized protein LOC123886308 [Trifolium pratense]
MRIKNTLNHLNKLIDYNPNLNEAQNNRLRQTPFKWVFDMTDHIKVSGPLLEELLSRWDSIIHGFRVGCKTVAFAPADVCIALGLQIVGTTVPVPLNDNIDCHVKSLFNGEDVTIDNIQQKLNVLNTEQDIEDFCRLYILFAFFALYFPKKSRNVTSVPFKLLDDLNLLETYNWGQAVYEDLVESINTAAAKYAQSGGDSGKKMILSGCSAILQLVEDLVPTEEDQQFDVVAEVIRQSEVMHTNDIDTDFDATAILRKQRILFDHNKTFRERIFMFVKDFKHMTTVYFVLM